jgi:cytochrome P450
MPFGNDVSQLPISFGSLSEFPDDPIACMRRLHDEHGNLAVLQDGTQRIVFVFGPEYNQQVLSDSERFHSRFFAVRGPKRSAQRHVTSGLLSMNGDEHKQHRRLVMEPFQKRSIVRYHESICRLVNDMLDDWNLGDVRDVHAEMTHFMLRLTSAILFGLDVPEVAYRLGTMIDRWVHMNHETGMGAFVSDSRYTSNYESLLELAEELEADVRSLIETRRTNAELGSDVLSLLIRAYDEEGRIDDAQLSGHVALLFGAAHLTTAHTLTWTLFLLSQHPSLARATVDEVTSVCSGSHASLDETARMPLVERVIKESMRILPASGYSQRITAEAVQLGPLYLPQGTGVVFSQFITHRIPELYAEPARFLPDRWLTISPSPYAYLPFGAGPRMCIGAPMAMLILKTALPTILKRFRLEMIAGAPVNGRIISTMLGPTSSVPMQVCPPDGRFTAQSVTGNIHDLVELPVSLPKSQAALRRAA